MGFKRRAFLIGGAVLVGGGAFGIKMADRSAKGRAVELTSHHTQLYRKYSTKYDQQQATKALGQ